MELIDTFFLHGVPAPFTGPPVTPEIEVGSLEVVVAVVVGVLDDDGGRWVAVDGVCECHVVGLLYVHL